MVKGKVGRSRKEIRGSTTLGKGRTRRERCFGRKHGKFIGSRKSASSRRCDAQRHLADLGARTTMLQRHRGNEFRSDTQKRQQTASLFRSEAKREKDSEIRFRRAPMLMFLRGRGWGNGGCGHEP